MKSSLRPYSFLLRPKAKFFIASSIASLTNDGVSVQWIPKRVSLRFCTAQ